MDFLINKKSAQQSVTSMYQISIYLESWQSEEKEKKSTPVRWESKSFWQQFRAIEGKVFKINFKEFLAPCRITRSIWDQIFWSIPSFIAEISVYDNYLFMFWRKIRVNR